MALIVPNVHRAASAGRAGTRVCGSIQGDRSNGKDGRCGASSIYRAPARRPAGEHGSHNEVTSSMTDAVRDGIRHRRPAPDCRRTTRDLPPPLPAARDQPAARPAGARAGRDRHRALPAAECRPAGEIAIAISDLDGETHRDRRGHQGRAVPGGLAAGRAGAHRAPDRALPAPADRGPPGCRGPDQRDPGPGRHRRGARGCGRRVLDAHRDHADPGRRAGRGGGRPAPGADRRAQRGGRRAGACTR